MEIFGNQQQSEEICGNMFKPMGICGNMWKSVEICEIDGSVGSLCKSVGICGNMWFRNGPKRNICLFSSFPQNTHSPNLHGYMRNACMCANRPIKNRILDIPGVAGWGLGILYIGAG